MRRIDREHIRHWRKLGRDRLRANRPPDAPDAFEQVRTLIAVHPEDAVYDMECRKTLRGVVDRSQFGKAHDGSDIRWHDRCRSAGIHTSKTHPVLVWEDVVTDLVLVPTYTMALVPKDKKMSTRYFSPVVAPFLIDAHQPAVGELLFDPVPSRILLPGWVGPDGPLDWGELGGLAPVRGAFLFEVPAGRRTVRVEAMGEGVVEAATLRIGRLEAVERYRRYTPALDDDTARPDREPIG